MARRQNPKIERTLKRTSSLRLVKQTFLIVCEGEVTMLSHLLGFRYGKTKGDSMKVFNVIYPKTRIAIGNAQKILESFDGSNPAKEESSTTVHQLVEQLLQFIE